MTAASTRPSTTPAATATTPGPITQRPTDHRSRSVDPGSVFLEVEGAAHYLPAYAGNLDIMTSAAIRTAEAIATDKAVTA